MHGVDPYFNIAMMMRHHGASFDFTCMELRNEHQEAWAMSGVEELVQQVKLATARAGVFLGGENALPSFYESGYEQVYTHAEYLHGEHCEIGGCAVSCLLRTTRQPRCF